jgi:hypothetical protein
MAPGEMSVAEFASGLRAELVLGFISLLLTLFIFIWQQIRLIRVQKQQTYQRLELASNELFRFLATHAEVLVHYTAKEPDPSLQVTEKDRMIADSAIYQTLNLFEMAARLRHANFFEHEVFGSWVVWYHELLTSWYFRACWNEIRYNYTKEMRQVFDGPVAHYDPAADEAESKRQFFAHVAKLLKCPVVANWLRA